jgi:hypothetical protein
MPPLEVHRLFLTLNHAGLLGTWLRAKCVSEERGGKKGAIFREELVLVEIVMYTYLYLCIFAMNLCRLQVKNLDGEEQVCYNVCNLWATL